MPPPRIARRFDRSTAPAIEKAFSQAECDRRLTRIRGFMEEAGIALLYATQPESMCYAHGYAANWYRTHAPHNWGPMQGTAIHVDHDRVIHFDQLGEDALLYTTSVCDDCRFFSGRGPEEGAAFILSELGNEGWLDGPVGLEMRSYQPSRYYSEMLVAGFSSAELEVVDGTDVVRLSRRIKSPVEIACVEKATHYADVGMQAARDTVRAGVTELEVQAEVARALYAAGSEISAIPIMIHSGPVSGGHHMTSRRVIEPGDSVMMDVSGVHNRYHGNIERGFALDEPEPAVIERYRKAAGAFDVVAATARAGCRVADLNRELRDYYRDAGLDLQAGWAIGYELGITFPPDWVDEFNFSYDIEDTDQVFEDGLVCNFESLFSTYLIDTFVVEKEGARFLSNTPLELLTVG